MKTVACYDMNHRYQTSFQEDTKTEDRISQEVLSEDKACNIILFMCAVNPEPYHQWVQPADALHSLTKPTEPLPQASQCWSSQE